MNEPIDEISRKYKKKLQQELGQDTNQSTEEGADEGTDEIPEVDTQEYEHFKDENALGDFSTYERWANRAANLLQVAPNEQKRRSLQQSIDTAHLNITPTGAMSFSVLIPLMIMLIGSMLSYMLLGSMFLVAFCMLGGVITIPALTSYPEYLAKKWRNRASQQMVLSIFYVVTYMRHTSNLEKAVQFAADYLGPPLSLEFKNILWNIETERYATMRESLDHYLEQWRDTHMEFVEAFHLIESSLYEGTEERRLQMLDKALDVILNGTYEKMLHFAQNLKSPVNTLNMLGVILPILGLVILPMMVSFMDGVAWFHIAALYNVGLPIGVFLFGKSILVTRPSGSSSPGTGEGGVTQRKKKRISMGNSTMEVDIRTIPVMVAFVLLLIGFSPLIMHALNPAFDISFSFDDGFIQGDADEAQLRLLDFQEDSANPDQEVGPFGLGAALLSLCVPLSFGVSAALYFRMKSEGVEELREQSQKLELEFSSALFQMGNRLADGFPAEMVFGKVAGVMEGTASGNFFKIVDTNIKRAGMNVSQALFNEKTGAIHSYPSPLIKSSMKVLLQSMRKGPAIAAQAVSNVARYIKEIHQVNERLRDLMTEVVSSMNSQVRFLSPLISGIVVGITSMITTILGKLSGQMDEMSSMAGQGGGGMMSMFGQGIPTFHFQIIVGLYVVQLSYILTVIKNEIENGEDKVGETYQLGQNMMRSVGLYSTVTFIVMVLFNLLAATILQGTVGGG